MKRGFTLIELLGVTAVLAVLAALIVPLSTLGVFRARSAVCASNLRQMAGAYQSYMQDNQGRLFRFREDRGSAYLYYFGYDADPQAPEGSRTLDKSQARLAPYLPPGTVETCPSFPYRASFYKPKYGLINYGYGLNVYLLTDQLENKLHGPATWFGVAKPSQTLLWADAAQINTHQFPASASRPMLEEWYYVHQRTAEKPAFHFRHDGRLQTAFCDGSVRVMSPHELRPEADGRTGYLGPRGSDLYLTASQ
jgi:prepilin-type N-terminal cleavage/methylation domain-containing protein/prepilin-type processing-associated H-X9-DG protein